jgi:hypothetical protein
MKQSTWGPTYWSFLHILSISFPDQPTSEQKTHFRQCLEHLAPIMPCEQCRNHMTEYLRTVEWDKVLTTKETCMRFVWEFHNSVNQRLGKPLYSWDQLIDTYETRLNASEWNPIEDAHDLIETKEVLFVVSLLLWLVLMGISAYSMYHLTV